MVFNWIDAARRTQFCVLLCLVLLAGSAAAQDYGGTGRPAADVSLVAIIANPEKFAGQSIRTYGVVHFEFEGDSLYLSKQDREYGIYKNAVWIDVSIPGVTYEQLSALNGKFVAIEGRVNATDHGHLGLWSATIERVSRVQVLE